MVIIYTAKLRFFDAAIILFVARKIPVSAFVDAYPLVIQQFAFEHGHLIVDCSI